ncbi:hypothetical protein ABPG74_003182 [Tetrahymena malaccensis]
MSLGRINQLLFGKEFLNYLNEINILLIGVGGIGCEVLKVLQQFKVKSLHILDLDTIEVSNLNRQFLFRKHHRGHFKAHVARDVLKQEYPDMNIISYNSNIKDAQFGLKFFKNFQLVIMALDNQETRSFVNKQCMILNIPLIDAGTTGYKGQSFILKRGETRCYDCFPRSENKKTYPACTIRTLPEKPVHCIIWAKYLYTVLFNEKLEDDDDSNLLQDIAKYIEGENHTDLEKGQYLFKAIFETDVNRQKEGEDNQKFQHLKVLIREELEAKLDKSENYLHRQDLKFLQSTHTEEVYMDIFIKSFEELIKEKRQKSCVPFEKDDNLCMKFITAACNLRCIVFSIPLQTQFQVKEVAGNIVPAIASTNSIVSAIEITETIKLLQRQFYNNPQKYKNRELYIQNDIKTKILDAKPGNFNPNCMSCNQNLLPHIIYCDFNKVTLGEFINSELRSKAMQNEEEDEGNDENNLVNFSISSGQFIIYEEDEYQEEDEQEQNEVKHQKLISDIFKDYSDSRVVVTNEDNNSIHQTYLFCHIENHKIPGLEIVRQEKNPNNTVTWKSVIAQSDTVNKEEEQKKQEEEQNQKSYKEVKGDDKNNNTLEILDSESEDDLVICEDNDNPSQGAAEKEKSKQSNGKQPHSETDVSSLNQKRKAVQEISDGGAMQVIDDSDDEIIFEDQSDNKKLKVD